MTIDKKIKYAIQGGGPNYLGKQKMVKAPKKWKSSPDHETAELAYITKKEKDILLDLNIYGSLKNGKPNRGPSGIMSLQGDMGSIGGGGGGGSSGGGGPHGGGGGGGWDPGVAAREQAAREASQRSRIQQEKQASLNAQRAAAVQQAAAQEAMNKQIGTSLHGGDVSDTQAMAKGELKKMIAQQQEEKYGVGADPTKFGETVDDLAFKNHPEARAKEAEEAIKQLSTPEGTKEALREFKALKTRRPYVPDVGLLEKLGIKKPQSFADMGTKQGLAGHAKSFAKNQAMQYAAKKLGLGSLFNPAMMLFSLFNKFGRGKKPAFDMEAASKLGLHANRFATTGGQFPTKKQYAEDLITPKGKPSTQIAKGTGLEKGYEMLGLGKGEQGLGKGAQKPFEYTTGDYMKDLFLTPETTEDKIISAATQATANMPKYHPLRSTAAGRKVLQMAKAGQKIPIAHGFQTPAIAKKVLAGGFKDVRPASSQTLGRLSKAVPTMTDIERAIRTGSTKALGTTTGAYSAIGPGSVGAASRYAQSGPLRGITKGTGLVKKGLIDASKGIIDRGVSGNLQIKAPGGVMSKALKVGPKAARVAGGVLQPSLTNKILGGVLPGVQTTLGAARALQHAKTGDYGSALMAGVSAIPGPIGWAGLVGEGLLSAPSLTEQGLGSYTGPMIGRANGGLIDLYRYGGFSG